MRGQEQHRDVVVFAQFLQDLPTIQAWHHDVEHDCIVVQFERHVQAVGAIACHVDDIARFHQALLQVGGRFRFVLHH